MKTNKGYWLSPVSLSEEVKAHILNMTEHCTDDEISQIIASLESHLSHYIARSRIEKEKSAAPASKKTIDGMVNQAQQFKKLEKAFNALHENEKALDRIKMHFQKQGSYEWKHFKTLQDKIPEAIQQISEYGKLLSQVKKDTSHEDVIKSKFTERQFFCNKVAATLKKYNIDRSTTRTNTSHNTEGRFHKLIRLMIKINGEILQDVEEVAEIPID